MWSPVRLTNIGLVIVAVIVVLVVLVSARSGGSSSNTGNADACNSFWNWYNSATSPSASATSAAESAYKSATTQPLKSDLQALSDGLRGNKNVDMNNAEYDLQDDCTNAGFANPTT
jgi:hypothetical protein